MAKGPDIPDTYHAPWERVFGRVLTPFEEFIHRETAGSVILIACTALALVAANSPLSGAYDALLHTRLVIALGSWTLDHTLHHWINDGLMALFFFVVGLEIKREVTVGELSDPRAAALPIITAIGGMAVPAIIYALFNAGGDGSRGWGIPMATDIAFAIGVLALLGNRVPKSLYTFLVALAIVDDLGAVAVIAIFYSERIVGEALAAAGACLGVLVVFNLAGVRNAAAHLAVSLLLWLAMLESGVHATVAGVLAAWTVPSRPKLDPARFSEHARGLMDRLEGLTKGEEAPIHGPEQRAIVQAVESGIHRVESPLQRLEHAMHFPVVFLVIPLFALANAGVPIDFTNMGRTLADAVPVGIVCGLVAGKLLGIGGLTALAVRLGVVELPRGCRLAHIVGAGLLAGIGFTMSIFIAELAFRNQPELIIAAKTAILLASLVSGVAGYLWLRFSGRSESLA
jgi:NhaA family Na+:H+ antiporter